MPTNPYKADLRTYWYVLAALLAVVVYFYGLDSQYIPKNGDEFPYAHITRLTAESGRLLPLQSEMNEMRNTKPPLLFWQGILSTDWGHEWTLWRLRYPCVIYTLLTALLIFLLGRRLSGQTETGFIAALVYLAFFSTYRFGRPFLTNPPEVFWLFLPFFALLYRGRAVLDSRVLFPLSAGVAIGIGLLYKSFVLLAPVGFTLAWWALREREYRFGTFLARDAWKLVVMGVVALGVFSLWFALDPDPQAIMREFVLGENLGKMSPHSGSYLSKLLWGGSSVGGLLLNFLSNAGLLVFPFVAVIYMAIAQRGKVEEPDKLLWIWVLTQFLFFCLPSQRSGRYLLDVMPAVALLLALNWQRIHRIAFVLCIVCSGVVTAGLGILSLRLQWETGGTPLYSPAYWFFLLVVTALAAVSILIRRLTRPMAPVAALLALLTFSLFLRPFDGALGNFAADARQYVVGKDVWVPCNFRAKDEGHRFDLPGAVVHGYADNGGLDLPGVSSRFPLFAFRMPLSQTPDWPGCTVIGERLVIRSRHSNKELKEMILGGKVLQILFAREYLIEAPKPGFIPPPDECR